jgi:Ca-activated chloride channel family protein
MRLRRLYGMALGLGLFGCELESSTEGHEQRKVLSVDGEGATLCGETCVGVHPGQSLAEGLIDSGPQTLVLEGDGLQLSALPHARLQVDERVELLEGSLHIVSPGGLKAAHELVLAGAVIRLEPEEALELKLESRERTAALTVLRGNVTLQRGERVLELVRGQTALLEPERMEVRYSASGLRWSAQNQTSPVPDHAQAAQPGSARGLGQMKARRPGTNAEIDGMRLASHSVEAHLEHGLARTVVEEVFENTTDQTLEGTLTFPIPQGATVSELVLWVGDEPVRAEMVEKKRAKAIFTGIVDDTVRPRDPALLELKNGQLISLSIFPIPARSKRKVRLAFDSVLPEVNGRGHYEYPFSKSTPLGLMSLRVRLEGACDVKPLSLSPQLSQDAAGTTLLLEQTVNSPSESLRVDYARGGACGDEQARTGFTQLLEPRAEEGVSGAAGLIRATLTSDASDALPPPVQGDLALVIDKSASQTAASFAQVQQQAKLWLAGLDRDESFVLLACDSRCESFPAQGLAAGGAAEVDRALAWLAQRKPEGASDIAASLETAAARLQRSSSRRVVMIGDGVPSAGALSARTLGLRVERALQATTDFRLVPLGDNVDRPMLQAIAEAGSGSVVPALEEGSDELVAIMRAPLVHDLELVLPPGVELAAPLPTAVRLGESLAIFTEGRAEPGALLSIVGRMGDAEFALSEPLTPVSARSGMVARQLAQARIAALELQGEAKQQAIRELSQQSFVLSRYTSMLVLENDAMFSAFGIPRTRGLEPDGVGQGAGVGALAEGANPWADPLGVGSGAGRLGGNHKSPVPRIRDVGASVVGGLPKDIVRRIVRQNFGSFRMCYENELRARPDLNGVVTVRFMIRPDGTATPATVLSNTANSKSLGACVARRFASLRFPDPEAGEVTVTYPISFTPPEFGGTVSFGMVSGFSSRSFSSGNDAWMVKDAELEAIEREAEKSSEKRSVHRALIRSRLAHGQFAAAREAALLFVELDPSSSEAHELLAETELASGHREASLLRLEELSELDPSSFATQLRVARALEAAGDDARACSHWRSANELRPHDDAVLVQSLRCRARVGGERTQVLAEAESLRARSRVSKLVQAIESWQPLGYEAPAEDLTLKLECSAAKAQCPTAIFVDTLGRVVSDVLPTRDGLSSPNARSLRLVLVGGSAEQPVTVALSERGQSRTVTLKRAERSTALQLD